MPIYTFDEKITGEGLLDEEIQYHESISVPEELLEKTEIKPSKAGIGPFLVSDQFGPCHAVLARLRNGENGKYAIYHAFAPYSTTKGFQYFLNHIKDNVEEIFVFQKSHPEKNLSKAPVLAVELSREFGMEVKRLHVEGYVCIIADSINNKIILAQTLHRYNASDYLSEKERVRSRPSKAFAIHKSSAISLEKSVEELLDLQKRDFFGDIEIPKGFLKEESKEEKKEVSSGSTTGHLLTFISGPHLEETKKVVAGTPAVAAPVRDENKRASSVVRRKA